MEEQIALFTSDQIDQHWGAITSLLDDTEWLSELYEPSDFYELIKTGQFQVWALDDGTLCAIVLTSIQVFPKKKILQIHGIKGQGLPRFVDKIEEKFEFLARVVGASEMRTFVRPGLEKLLRKRGARQIAIVLKREVGQGRIH